jgi:hypothetical protein
MNAHFIRIQRIQRDTRAILSQHREKLPYAAGVLLCLVIYIISIARDSTTRVYRTDGKPDFKDARVLGSQGESLYEGKEHLLNNNMKALLATQALLREKNDKLQTRLEVLEKVNSEKGRAVRPAPLKTSRTQRGMPPPLEEEDPPDAAPVAMIGQETALFRFRSRISH